MSKNHATRTGFKALADLTRHRIVRLIKQNNGLCVCELTEALDIIQPKVLRHLALLRKTGLLKHRHEGQWIFYSLSTNMRQWTGNSIDAAIAGCVDQ